MRGIEPRVRPAATTITTSSVVLLTTIASGVEQVHEDDEEGCEQCNLAHQRDAGARDLLIGHGIETDQAGAGAVAEVEDVAGESDDQATQGLRKGGEHDVTELGESRERARRWWC